VREIGWHLRFLASALPKVFGITPPTIKNDSCRYDAFRLESSAPPGENNIALQQFRFPVQDLRRRARNFDNSSNAIIQPVRTSPIVRKGCTANRMKTLHRIFELPRAGPLRTLAQSPPFSVHMLPMFHCHLEIAAVRIVMFGKFSAVRYGASGCRHSGAAQPFSTNKILRCVLTVK